MLFYFSLIFFIPGSIQVNGANAAVLPLNEKSAKNIQQLPSVSQCFLSNSIQVLSTLSSPQSNTETIAGVKRTHMEELASNLDSHSKRLCLAGNGTPITSMNSQSDAEQHDEAVVFDPLEKVIAEAVVTTNVTESWSFYGENLT